jgi:hypothetical protein
MIFPTKWLPKFIGMSGKVPVCTSLNNSYITTSGITWTTTLDKSSVGAGMIHVIASDEPYTTASHYIRVTIDGTLVHTSGNLNGTQNYCVGMYAGDPLGRQEYDVAPLAFNSGFKIESYKSAVGVARYRIIWSEWTWT